MKNVVILGSTGSIGRSALDVISAHPDKYRVKALAAGRNHELLLLQMARVKPDVVAVADEKTASLIRPHTGAKVLVGPEGMEEAAALDGVDFVLSAIVGAAGLRPTMAAVKAGRTIGLANKESLVVAGAAMMEAARASGATILPVDSEHSAVFQCMEGHDRTAVRKIILTASGGPFAGKCRSELGCITPEQALRHPSWSMGRKISIDSATLMNKGLEVIEAHHLFGAPASDIDVVVHPQSIIHSMVEFVDGSVMAQLSVPDMKGAIAYAMSYPSRMDGVMKRLDLAAIGCLTFGRPDTESFPCLGYAYEALRRGGTAPAVLNAANEVAVDGFLAGRIGFMGIPELIGRTMNEHRANGSAGLAEAMAAHDWAEARARELMGDLK